MRKQWLLAAGMTIVLISLSLVASTKASTQNDRPLPVVKADSDGSVFFKEQFLTKDSLNRWVTSKAKRSESSGELATYSGRWELEQPSDSYFTSDLHLTLKTQASHHAISSTLTKVYDPKIEDKLVMQYEVKFDSMPECNGAYIKMISAGSLDSLDQFNDVTPYTIMFGPDKCGASYKNHFIIKVKNPISGKITEHHSPKSNDVPQNIFSDGQTHLFRLEIVGNQYKIFVDDVKLESGNMLKDLVPSVMPPETIEDPEDVKPEDWDERERVPEKTAVKPTDWDEDAPQEIPDKDDVKPAYWLDDETNFIADESSNKKPDDFDEEIDGEWQPAMVENPKCQHDGENVCGVWTPRMITNPKYKGKWNRPMIKNPAYKGKWSPRRVKNPEYFKTDKILDLLEPISAIGLEVWAITKDIRFNNFVLANELNVPREFAKQLWKPKSLSEVPKGVGFVQSIMYSAAKQPYVYAAIGTALFFVIVAAISYFIRRHSSPQLEPSKADEAEVDTSEVERLVSDGRSDDDDDESREIRKRQSKDDLTAHKSDDDIDDAEQDIPGPQESQRRPRKDT